MEKKKCTSKSCGNTWLHMSGHCHCPLCWANHWRLCSCSRSLLVCGWKVGCCSWQHLRGSQSCPALPSLAGCPLQRSSSECCNSYMSLHCLLLPRWTKNFYSLYIIYILQMISRELEPTLSLARLTQTSESSLLDVIPWVSRGKFGNFQECVESFRSVTLEYEIYWKAKDVLIQLSVRDFSSSFSKFPFLFTQMDHMSNRCTMKGRRISYT